MGLASLLSRRGALAALALSALPVLLAFWPSAAAAAPPSTCGGRYLYQRGDELEVTFRFKCDAEFKYFSVRTNKSLDLFDGNALVFTPAGTEQVAAFDCEGGIPTRRVLCHGTKDNKAQARQLVIGKLGLERDSCRGLRVVVRAGTADGETSDLFPLRAPRSCRRAARH